MSTILINNLTTRATDGRYKVHTYKYTHTYIHLWSCEYTYKEVYETDRMAE